ncbi:hypothetical protein GCM10027416_32040 [Okibacterium endophyticum]
MSGTWTAVVPVKGTSASKSRLEPLAARVALARAFALDTIVALTGASLVDGVIVVTRDQRIAEDAAHLGSRVVPEQIRAPADPLNDAILQGIEAALGRNPLCDIVVFASDLPALDAAEVDAALGQAAHLTRAMIPDACGAGTVALLARAGASLTPRFGAGSRAAHEGDGHVPLDIPPAAAIRRDVDVVDDLAHALRLGVGEHTSTLIASTSYAATVPSP